jgi:hypothetical protein
MEAKKLQLWLVFSERDHMRREIQKAVKAKRRLIDLPKSYRGDWSREQ